MNSRGASRARTPRFACIAAAVLAWVSTAPSFAAGGEALASSVARGTSPRGPLDGDRFSIEAASLWRGESGAAAWWWEIRFEDPRRVGAILQIHGTDAGILRQAPGRYIWQASEDGRGWIDLPETRVDRERRLFRIHRLPAVRRVRCLRLRIDASIGDSPALREVEFGADPDARISFPDWIVAVATTERDRLPGETGRFVDLARACAGWEAVQAQQVWLGDFDRSFVDAEPRPLCAFLSGNVTEWCQRTREPFRGLQEILARRDLPMWGSCGGAQALAILQETGVDRPWDCPRCRDPEHPKSPVYSHIGHTGDARCGDYSKSVGERGRFRMRKTADDPAFAGLPAEFEVMESHIGQIAYVPEGWVRVVTRGPGALTENQCLRVRDRYIYAAQFHIEMAGTPETSRTIMRNFLELARRWKRRDSRE
ncbi:MAG: hypothetical protein JXP34_09265 [Planctomycetes bacterium]|nr:hypothetical protein [Planctomycetota bacterium]